MYSQINDNCCVFHDNIEMVLVSQEKGSDQSRNLKMDDLGLVN